MSCKHTRVYIKISTVKMKILIIWKHNRECALFNIITNTNDRLTCIAAKVCISVTNSMYAGLICLPFFFINRLNKKIIFLLICKKS